MFSSSNLIFLCCIKFIHFIFQIKQLEKQQKDQIPFVFIREIPNKPPPPYKPPIKSSLLNILPDSGEIDFVVGLVTKYFQNNYLNKSLPLGFAENLLSNNVMNKEKFNFVCNICKEIAVEHYEKFNDNVPTWMILKRKNRISENKFSKKSDFEQLMKLKLKQIFNYQNNEDSEILNKWCSKKRDHIDKILILESQYEELDWTNYEYDELTIFQEITTEILNVLILESLKSINDCFIKKGYFC